MITELATGKKGCQKVAMYSCLQKQFFDESKVEFE